MEITLHGVRGSISVSGPETVYYGGNTACLDVRTTNGDLFIFDAGSGLRILGDTLPRSGECRLFISHGHADHIQGLGFFAPLHTPAWTTHLYLPIWAEQIPDLLFTGGLFPLPLSSFDGAIVPHFITPGDVLTFADSEDGARVEVLESNHPGKCLAFRLHADKTVFFYSGDHEITAAPESRQHTLGMLEGADIAVVDAMYGRQSLRPDWGHSAWEDWVELARQTERPVTSLILSHHAPGATDAQLDSLQATLPALHEDGKGVVYLAREGMHFSPPFDFPDSRRNSDWLQRFLDELTKFKDEHTILDRILAKARELTRADAGTVFLVEQNELVFAYTHNDSLFSVNSASKHAYSTLRLPISKSSIAGYAAATGEALNIPDVRVLPRSVPYSFNADVDASTGYRTCSMLTVPLKDHTGGISGVIQLINRLDPGGEAPLPFTREMEIDIKSLSREAAVALERSSLLRKNIYGLLRMAAVHDPVETGPHAERVGAIAAEIYQYRADRLRLDPDAARHEKSAIRLAAMLHDVGKVGISDLVLKKPGKLTEEEFTVMRGHTGIGSSILDSGDEDIYRLARDIALHHHQKWNGKGYSGSSDEGRLSGEDIPLAARITAIADVFDALVSPRCYKGPWTFDEALEHLRKEAGQHFDPFLVECMENIMDLVLMICKRYPDSPDSPGNSDEAQPGGAAHGA